MCSAETIFQTGWWRSWGTTGSRVPDQGALVRVFETSQAGGIVEVLLIVEDQRALI